MAQVDHRGDVALFLRRFSNRPGKALGGVLFGDVRVKPP